MVRCLLIHAMPDFLNAFSVHSWPILLKNSVLRVRFETWATWQRQAGTPLMSYSDWVGGEPVQWWSVMPIWRRII